MRSLLAAYAVLSLFVLIARNNKVYLFCTYVLSNQGRKYCADKAKKYCNFLFNFCLGCILVIISFCLGCPHTLNGGLEILK